GVPTISIFLKPPGVISPGGSTTICCSCQCAAAHPEFVLYKNGHPLRTLEVGGSRAEFSISNATQEDTGVYNCHYADGGTVLARSEALELTVQEFRLPTPVLSVLPGHEVDAGADVVLHCTIAAPGAACLLYLEGHMGTVSWLPKDQDEFNISHVDKSNEGRYSCQCFTRDAFFSWSAVSQSLDLVVR
ncbi:IGSF1 protein, partial [Bucco capensis]|nr:IGSF1 protein [Bucco capensis]